MNEYNDLIRDIKARGWAGPARLLLDALEPVGPLGAQVVWASQPLLSTFFSRGALTQLATALEHPDELDRLRQALDTADPPTTD